MAAHHTYLAPTSPLGPLAVSIIPDPHDHTYKLVIRSTSGSTRTTVPFSSIPPPRFLRRLFGYGIDPLTVLAVASPQTPQRTLKHCTDPYLPKELLAVEERQIIRSYKFGVAYVGGDIEGTEDGMLACRMEQTSPAFHEFLGWLGDTIELKGWKGYRGGLDIKDNSTGMNSVYTEFHGYEIMYHVAPLLPNSPRDEQHVERKRHLGNDIVLIVFNDRIEGEEERIVQLETVTSRQNRILLRKCGGKAYMYCD
ncbi:hypothetical protein BC937DRAFT_92345 [Endogone sp. FLAS-F59071]|nr:hypothetical protein BC937DRAFT_92345 [Endogone sp. FLAS-F59071]|eukprot:RUS21539.1 hypothetical protein BC937DRAFT_92345 [Endogone sp. FLAS-F59071]